MSEKTNVVDYVRCPKCSYVYEATSDECPHCHTATVINEEMLEQKVFNIID